MNYKSIVVMVLGVVGGLPMAWGAEEMNNKYTAEELCVPWLYERTGLCELRPEYEQESGFVHDQADEEAIKAYWQERFAIASAQKSIHEDSYNSAKQAVEDFYNNEENHSWRNNKNWPSEEEKELAIKKAEEASELERNFCYGQVAMIIEDIVYDVSSDDSFTYDKAGQFLKAIQCFMLYNWEKDQVSRASRYYWSMSESSDILGSDFQLDTRYTHKHVQRARLEDFESIIAFMNHYGLPLHAEELILGIREGHTKGTHGEGDISMIDLRLVQSKAAQASRIEGQDPGYAKMLAREVLEVTRPYFFKDFLPLLSTVDNMSEHAEAECFPEYYYGYYSFGTALKHSDPHYRIIAMMHARVEAMRILEGLDLSLSYSDSQNSDMYNASDTKFLSRLVRIVSAQCGEELAKLSKYAFVDKEKNLY